MVRDARNAERQIATCQAALEQVAEVVAQVRRGRFIPVGRLAGGQSLEEGNDVAGRGRAEFDLGFGEAEVEEPICEAPAVTDRSLGEAPLPTEIILVVTPQRGLNAAAIMIDSETSGHTWLRYSRGTRHEDRRTLPLRREQLPGEGRYRCAQHLPR